MIKLDDVKMASQNRWRDAILPALGINVPSTKSKHGPCPICGGKDRFRFDDRDGRGTWLCNPDIGCGAGDGFSLVQKAKDWDFVRAGKEIGAILGLSAESQTTDEERQKWKEKAERQRIQAEQDEIKAQESAAKRAQRLWSANPVDRDCPYLDRKQVQNHGCKINGKGNLIVPLFDVDGKIWNVQEIHADGYKPYLKGGRVNACFYMIGQIEKPYDIVCIAEGYATGASVYEATGHTTVVAFQAGNIDKVAIALRGKYPELNFVYCADDDSHSNPPDAGLKAANRALAATGGIVILPDFSKVATT